MTESKAQIPQYCTANKVGVSYGIVTLKADSSYTAKDIQVFREGEVFEILAETKEEHLDKSEYQLFNWYKVKTTTGLVGWLYGEGLAIALPLSDVPKAVEKYHFKTCSFTNGFERSYAWAAAIQGRENVQRQSFLNPPYVEYFLIIMNDRQKAVLLPLGTSSNTGDTKTLWIKEFDINGDQSPELVVNKKTNLVSSSSVPTATLEIFSFQSGTLVKIFDEFLTLFMEDDRLAPSQQKIIEIAKNSIRIEYLDFMRCNKYVQPLPYDSLSKSWDHCIEYYSQIYGWDKKQGSLKSFYLPIRNSPSGKIITNATLWTKPSEKSVKIATLLPNEIVTVVKMYESYTPKLTYYLYVKTRKGVYGYVAANKVTFFESEHNAILQSHFNNLNNNSNFEYIRFR